MKKLLIAFLSVLFLTTTQAGIITIVDNVEKELPQYFRDVKATAKLNIAIDSAISREILTEGSFFRPNGSVPAVMFWRVILLDAGLGVKNDNFAGFLTKAVAENLLSAEEIVDLGPYQPITKFETIQALIKTKKVLPSRRISQKFREIYPLVDEVEYKKLPYIEAAYASGMLSAIDLERFGPNQEISRREFITWVYNYFDHGTRQIKIEADKAFLWNKRSFRSPSGLSLWSRFTRSSEVRIPRKNTNEENLTVRILRDEDLQKVSAGVRFPFPGKETLDEIYNEIMTRYRLADELTAEKKQEMIDSALTALVKELGDKYSNYVKPAKTEAFINGLDGEFEGIGAYVETIDEAFTIVAPLADSPAEKAGLLPGDIVIKVDDKEVGELSLYETVDLIMGPAGTTVKLKISRDSVIYDFTVIRDKIIEPAVVLKWEGSIPVVEIHQFNDNTIALLREVLPGIMEREIRGIVFDLRNNPGGYIESAIDVSSLFLAEGEIIFYTEDRGGTIPFVAEKDGVLLDLSNIVIIQNKGSASASEILTGMLQDYEKATIVGTNSRGKGTTQAVHALKNGGKLKLTISKWLTPSKRWIEEEGISPDLEVSSPTIGERRKKIDRQLDAAVREVLNG